MSTLAAANTNPLVTILASYSEGLAFDSIDTIFKSNPFIVTDVDSGESSNPRHVLSES
jgi:hypothetical protein